MVEESGNLDPDSPYYTVKEAAQRLKVTERTIRSRIKAGTLTAQRFGSRGQWRIPVAEVDPLPGAHRKNETAHGGIVVGGIYEVWQGSLPNRFVRAASVDEIPPGSGSVLDFGPLEAEQTISRPLAETLGLEPDVLARLCINVRQDLEVTLIGKVMAFPGVAGLRHVVDAYTPQAHEGSWFWLYGSNKVLHISIKNPTRQAVLMSRVGFWGWRAKTEIVQQPAAGAIQAITRGWT